MIIKSKSFLISNGIGGGGGGRGGTTEAPSHSVGGGGEEGASKTLTIKTKRIQSISHHLYRYEIILYKN